MSVHALLRFWSLYRRFWQIPQVAINFVNTGSVAAVANVTGVTNVTGAATGGIKIDATYGIPKITQKDTPK